MISSVVSSKSQNPIRWSLIIEFAISNRQFANGKDPIANCQLNIAD
jgi:hypothetical protein